MEELIERLDRCLREHRADYYRQLSNGVSATEFATFEEALGIALPTEFRLFYYWKNGQGPGYTPGHFIYNYKLMPLKNILSDYNITKEVSEAGEFELKNWWSEKWIPFLENGAGDSLCIDMEGSFGGEKGQIIQFYHDWEVREIVHESFYKWVETIKVAIEQDFLPYAELDNNQYDIAYDTYKGFLKDNNIGYPKEYEAG